MKSKILTMFVACTAVMFAFGEEGTERHWTGAAGNNDWTDSGNYDEYGVPDPAAQDTLVFPSDARVTLNGNDADSCNIAQHLYRMKVAEGASNVVITVNVPENGIVNIDGAIVPTGDSYSDSSWDRLHIVKKGPGLLQLNSDGKVHATNGERYGTDYYSKFLVEEGTLRCPTNFAGAASNHVMFMGYLAVSNGATAFTANGRPTAINNLYGAGLVTNDYPSSQTVRIDVAGDFSGELNGSLSYDSRGAVMLRGTNSTMTSDRFLIEYNRNNGTKGVTGVVKIGMAFEPSSIGLASNIYSHTYGGKLLYLGTGEHTDKKFYVRTNPDYQHIIDAGATGGIVWEGLWGQYNDGIGMVRLVLQGANTVPCEMKGKILSYDKANGTNFTFHISKQGTGTWHLRHNEATTMTGGFTVLDGVLRFDTIGETNVVTSLGKATNLATDYGANYWDETKVRPYAHTLGNRTKNTAGTLEYMGETNCYSHSRATVISGTGVLKQSGTGALVMSGFSPIDANDATLVLDGGNTSTSNVAANVTDSESGGVLSVVKRGAGAWTITENATFTGPLSVEEGTLVLKPAETNYTWFKWTWQERFTNKDTTGTSTVRYTMGVSEFALYDSEGSRCNLRNLSDHGENLESSGGYYFYPHICDGGWFGWFDDDSWQYLNPGECSVGHTVVAIRTYRVWSNSTTTFANEPLYPSYMFDGTTEYFSGFVTGKTARYADETTWLPIILRLPDGVGVVKYWDYAHAVIAGRGVMISKLEGSVDGRHWEYLDSYDCGQDGCTGASTWQFKEVALGSESQSTLGVPGREIRGTTTNVWNFMTGNPVVSVKPGATLKAVGDVTLKNIKLDASTGAGTFDGFTFAADTQVEVTNLNAGEACIVPASFQNAAGLDDASGWTWTFVSQTGRTLRGRGAVSATGVRYIPMGTRISIQ